MKWIRKGLLFSTASDLPEWAHSSALQPSPLVLDERRVRLYCGFRDAEGVSRVGYVEIEKHGQELRVARVSSQPVLDIGTDGRFDDNGVVPSCIVPRDGRIYLYYAGYQLVKKVRFLVLGGLAVSDDGGETFERYQETPVLERTPEESLFRVAHTVLADGGRWRVWYGGGDHFERHGERTLPVYDIRYMESADGVSFPKVGQTVLENAVSEHRVGRPYVIKTPKQYYLFFGASTPSIPYRLAYATSADGYTWTRQEDFGLDYSENDFDSEMSAYPSVITLEGVTYLIYNGNNYGAEGFGYAILDDHLEA